MSIVVWHSFVLLVNTFFWISLGHVFSVSVDNSGPVQRTIF